ncbi:MAG: thioesterase family protein [Phycisphaerales bacterium]
MPPAREHSLPIRVRYCECDPMGVAHHSVYPVWFEMGRTELLRTSGRDYRTFEEQGIFLAVVSLVVKYKRPARYDDLLTLITRLDDVGHVKIEHSYELRRGEETLAIASTTLACLDRGGRAQPLPDILREGIGGSD